LEILIKSLETAKIVVKFRGIQLKVSITNQYSKYKFWSDESSQ